MSVTDQLAKTDMLDTNKVDPNDVSVLVVVRHDGRVVSYEGHATSVEYSEEPKEHWYELDGFFSMPRDRFTLRRSLHIEFNGEDIIQRVVKE